MLWKTVAKTSDATKCAGLIEKFLFIPLLLQYLDVIDDEAGSGIWSADQKKKLRMEAIGVLFTLVIL